MNNDVIIEHIKYIASTARENGDKLTTIVLVKLLYLLDLCYARETGHTLTGWKWKFHSYGPWCYDSFIAIETAARTRAIIANKLPNKFSEEDFTLYEGIELDTQAEHQLDVMIPVRVQSALKSAVQKFGGNTYRLLNHVYFETEPMKDAEPGQDLVFAGLSWPNTVCIPSSLQPLSKSKLAKARAAIAELRKIRLARKVRTRCATDSVFEEGLRWLNEADRDPISVSGVASIQKLFGQAR